MGFKESEADALLIACHRRCCVCHRSCGFKMELHHIEQRSQSNDDSIENAIPLCFECHAEVQLYNDRHPRGRKFHPRELKGHKEQWLRICKEQPNLAFSSPRAEDGEVGPLNSLIDEIEFNLAVLHLASQGSRGCPLANAEFTRAIRLGAVSLLGDELKQAIYEAYAHVGRFTTLMVAEETSLASGMSHSIAGESASIIEPCCDRLRQSRQELLCFLDRGVD